jgi:hypothetical protein
MPAPLPQPGAKRAHAHRGVAARDRQYRSQPAATIPRRESPRPWAGRILVVMATLSRHLIVDAPADAVWEVVGHRFDRVDQWATAIPASSAIPAATAVPPTSKR